MASQSSFLRVLDTRIRETREKIEALRDDLALATADMASVEVSYTEAIERAKQDDQAEIQAYSQEIGHYQDLLADWKQRQADRYQAEVDRRKSLSYQLVIFLAGMISFGLFLVVQIQEIRGLQAKRDQPPFEDEQRRWLKEIDSSHRQLNFLRSLAAPRESQEMKDLQRERVFLRRKRDSLEQQLLFKEFELATLEHQYTDALAFGGGSGRGHSSRSAPKSDPTEPSAHEAGAPAEGPVQQNHQEAEKQSSSHQEEALVRLYQDVRDGRITDPEAIREIAARFLAIARDPEAHSVVSFDAHRAAANLYEQAAKYDASSVASTPDVSYPQALPASYIDAEYTVLEE